MLLLHRVEILVLCRAHHEPLYSLELAVYRNWGVKNCLDWETFTVFDHILINSTFAHGTVNSNWEARRGKESEDYIFCHLWAASRAMQRSGTGEHWLSFNTLYFLWIGFSLSSNSSQIFIFACSKKDHLCLHVSDEVQSPHSVLVWLCDYCF